MSEYRGGPEEGVPNEGQDVGDDTAPDQGHEQLGDEGNSLTDSQPQKQVGQFGMGIESVNDPQELPDEGGPT